MAQRPDLEMIKRLSNDKTLGFTGNIGEKFDLKQALELPYFYLADKDMDEHHFCHDIPIEFMDPCEFVYEEFVFSAKKVVPPTIGRPKTIANYWAVVKPNHPKEGVCSLKFFLHYEGVGICFGWHGETSMTERFVSIQSRKLVRKPSYDKAMRSTHGLINALRSNVALQDGDLTVELGKHWSDGEYEKFMDGVEQQVLDFYSFMNLLMNYLKYGDKHAVEVTPIKRPKISPILRKKRPWSGATGPRVLLLDRMPATQTQSTGTHASPKPHRRRGHWKTLSHPRFRHHPQYGKKIYVKPSFVGPRQAKYEGNIYRLREPLDQLVAI